MRTFGEVLDESRGLGHGFDFLRVALAIAVVVWHAPELALGTSWVPGGGVIWLGAYSVLIMFFGLSGFLITGSALRLSLRNFLINRGLRIFPALAVEIVLSALILGPIFTSLSLYQYFTSIAFFRYFTNIIGIINFCLPGVFNGEWVNGSLWTVPFEMGCYFLISVMIYNKLLHKPWTIILISIIILLIEASLVFYGFSRHNNQSIVLRDHIINAPNTIVDYIFHGRGSRLIVSFSVGVAFYLYRYKIYYSPILFFGAIIFIIISEYTNDWHDEDSPMANIFLVIPVVYITIYVGLLNIPRLPFFYRGDYSYGIYLYGWPVSQAMKFSLPEYGKNPVLLLAMSLLPIILFAAISWHFVERPILQFRRKFSFVARQRLAESGADPKLTGAACDQPVVGG